MHDASPPQMTVTPACAVPRRRLLALVAGLLPATLLAAPGAGARKRRKKRCKGRTTRCGGACVNVKTNVRHCARCNAACPGGQICQSGRCGCAAGQSFVLGRCISARGCTASADTCVVGGAEPCPDAPAGGEPFCFLTPDGQPFCGDVFGAACSTLANDAACTAAFGKPALLLRCAQCEDDPQQGNSVCIAPAA